jgi:hypothetical protein
LRSERLGRQLRGYLDPRYRGIFRHIPNLVHLDAVLARQRGLQLIRQRRRLGIATRKRPHKPRKLRLRQRWGKVDAGNSRGNQQLGKTSFAGGRSERNAIQQNLVPRRTEQHSPAAALIQGFAQLFPGDLKLRSRPRVPELIQARELQQNV